MARRRRLFRNKFVDWAVLLVLIAAAAYGSSMLPGNEVSGRVKHLDGDSFFLGDDEIRLYGIDAPEGRQICTNAKGDPYKCGRQSARVLRKLVAGREITCEVLETDRYDRSLARCKAGNTDLNLEMIRRGWAVAYRNTFNEFADAEAEARQAKRGLWQGLFDRPRDWRRMNAAKADASGASKPVPD